MAANTPRRPVPRSAKKTAEVLYEIDNHTPHDEEEHHEEPNEKWLVAYSDMMTLLFGFFVLMYSMSTVDQEKFDQTAASASERFGTIEGAGGFGGAYQDPTEVLDRKLAKEIEILPTMGKEVDVEKGKYGLEINFRGKSLFGSGSASVSPEGEKLLSEIAREIKDNGSQFSIRVEGHTDDVPISTARFPSNWELSASRAISVIKIFKKAGIPAGQLEAIGYAETRPLEPNRSPAGVAIPENMSKNRRVMVKLQRIFEKK